MNYIISSIIIHDFFFFFFFFFLEFLFSFTIFSFISLSLLDMLKLIGNVGTTLNMAGKYVIGRVSLE